MLKQLKLELSLKDKRTKLSDLIKRQTDLNTRAQKLRDALAEATEQDDIDMLNRQTEELENEVGEIDFEAEISKIKDEIADLENQLKEINDKPAVTEEPAKEQKSERKVGKPMNRRSVFYKLSDEKRERILKNDEVRTFLDQTRAILKRELTGAVLTVPEVMTDLVKETTEKYSKLLPYVNVESVSGDATIPVMGVSPEGVWSEAIAGFSEADLSFFQVKVGNFLISSYIPVNNTWLKDSDTDLAANIIEALGRGNGKGVDRAILYGTGNNMPLGIVTRLAQAVKPDNWDANAPEWKDLHESNILKFDLASKSGTVFFKQIAEIAGIPDDTYADGDLIWIMNHKTAMKYRANALAFDSAAALQAKMANEMPGIGGTVIEVPCVPDGDTIVGYGSLYKYVEREKVTMTKSEHVKFLANQTVFACLARGDGEPVFGEAFVAFNINNVAPATTSKFAGAKE